MNEWLNWLSGAGAYLRNKIVEDLDGMVPEVPSWYSDACSEVQGHMAANMGWAGAILPLEQLALAGALVVFVLTSTLGIRLFRILISVKTGGGGA